MFECVYIVNLGLRSYDNDTYRASIVRIFLNLIIIRFYGAF